jgi:hypothetical protein
MAITDGDLKLHRAYETYRKRIVKEDTLINHRMTWMILSESIMFVLFGVLFGVAGRADDHTVNRFFDISNTRLSLWSMIAISAFGLLIAFISLISIRAAQREISDLVYDYTRHHSDAHESPLIPGLTGKSYNHQTGHILPNILPWLIIIIWFVAFPMPQ